MNLVELVLGKRNVGSWEPALMGRDFSMGRQELLDRVLEVASGLGRLGLEEGGRVGLCLPNGPAFVAAYFGILAAGGVAVPLSPLLRPPEWRELALEAGIGLQLVDGRMGRLLGETAEEGKIRLVEASPETGTFPDLAGSSLSGPASRDPDDPAVFAFTAAYDGYLRAAILTHGSLAANARACVETWQVVPEDRVAAFLPLFHGFGTMTCLITPLLAGGTSVLLERFAPSTAAQILASKGVTIFPAVPAMLAQMLGDGSLGSDAVRSVRNITAGGAALPRELAVSVGHACGVTVLEGYGLTENSPVVSVNRDAQSNRPGSVGLPLPGVEVAVGTFEERLGPGKVGEILVHGPSVMAGYHDAPELTARFLKNGWLRTRDLGYLGEDGYLFLTGRALPLAIVGEFNVYPAELERVLAGHPAVVSVKIRSVSDPVYGDQLEAHLELEPGISVSERELASWCRRRLSAYKVPRRFVL